MPRKPARPCKKMGCPNLVKDPARKYCPEHQALEAREQQARHRAYDRTRPTASRRGYDRDWQTIRNEYIKLHPRCEKCNAQATLVHHITPVKQGGTNVWTNLMSLCVSCHNRIHSKEKER